MLSTLKIKVGGIGVPASKVAVLLLKLLTWHMMTFTTYHLSVAGPGAHIHSL